MNFLQGEEQWVKSKDASLLQATAPAQKYGSDSRKDEVVRPNNVVSGLSEMFHKLFPTPNPNMSAAPGDGEKLAGLSGS